ncbi:MAG: aminotransferase class V-fold PLP-dependent enzyme, partial [Cohaesibacteraceae bacterium]|nr:aminotransferase class V-fold PLP-dependent enzyme [Cohaesibacteraceae bacterium]
MSTHSALDETFIRSQFPALSNGWTFFDNAGGSQIVKGAVSRISEYLFEKNVQIGGTYETSRAAADALYAGRTAMKTFMNATREEEIIFGHSTTVLLQNLANSMRSQLSPGDEIVVTVADHESNIGPWVRLEEFGIVIKFWPFNHESGDLEIEDLVPLMSDKTRLVCVHHVSNVVGVVQPVAQIASLVHEYGAKLCVDGVAYAPHRAIDVQAWDVDYYVFSLYKTYGPHCAVMYGKYDLLLELDSLYHYFYGKDKVPGKLEPGNPNYELAYSSTGIVDYLIETGEQAGATGSDRDK